MNKKNKGISRGIDKNSVMIKKIDKPLFCLTIILACLGIIFIYSATKSLGSSSKVIVQAVSMLLGIASMMVVTMFDYEQFKNIIKPIYIFSIAILLLVLIFGVTGDWGARSWIRIGSVGFQPSELAKICFIITFAYHLDRIGSEINKPAAILGLLIHIGIPIFLILMQPDLGSALVFIFIFICLMFMARLSYKYIIPIGIAGIASLPFIYKYVLSEYQQKRIQVFFNPNLDPLNRGYNVIQSKIAVGSGQLWGKGYLEGTQNQMGFLPTKSTDFIFSVISEEFGFIGSMLVVLLLFALIWRCFTIAKRADNAYGRYICIGVGAMFLFHVFENVGMCIGLMPVTGIPLPFMSYGGTSLVTNMLAVGLVLSVAYHNKPMNMFDVY